MLVEASPKDKIWGIGLTAHDSKAINEREWRGTNLLGKCLMRAREQIIKSEMAVEESKNTSQVT